jgi:hypothetical protein
MTRISEAEFARIVNGLKEDRADIIKHNPIGPDDEILLWMLLAVLISFLNLTEIETPCFTGTPNADTYKQAVLFVLRNRKTDEFDAEKYLAELT